VIGDSTFFNFSQTPTGSDSSIDLDSKLKGGVAAIDTIFDNTFVNDPTFASLFIEDFGSGYDGSYQGNSKVESKIVASFDIAAKTTFSFDFSAELEQIAKEVENPDAEYNFAKSKIGFLIIDNSRHRPKIIDYFGIKGKLITSNPTSNLRLDSSRRVTIVDDFKETDIDGNNGTDSLFRSVLGTYERKFKKAKNITIVKINESDITLKGDTLIGKLGEDVIYGSIKKDTLKGTKGDDKIYASLGNDKLIGKHGDDILEGGQGNDRLKGGKGNDQLNGGEDDDIIIGGRGSDMLVGGAGEDEFIFHRNNFRRNDIDTIEDFELGSDRIVLRNWGNFNLDSWLDDMFSLGNITDTNDGVLFEFENGRHQGQLLLNGLTSSQVNSSMFMHSGNRYDC
ncbi:MAG: calcium-binding protein, partial [Cyanobacteria bacterium P01_A01_bin.84]